MAAVTTMSSIAYAHYTLYEALPRIARRGFKQIEIGSFGDYCYHFNYGSPTAPQLKGMLADHGLEPIALNWSPALTHDNDPSAGRKWLDAYKRKMNDALEVGIPMMLMHFGGINDRNDQEAQHKTVARAYRDLAEHALSCQMKMLLELPHLHLIHHTVPSVQRLLADLDLPNVGILLDASHWGVIGYDLDEYLHLLGDRLWHIHLRDASPHADPERDRKFVRPPLLGTRPFNLTLTPGMGKVDFAHLNRALDRIGYQGDVTTEFEYFDMTLDEIERQYDAGLAHLRVCGWELPAAVGH